MAAGEREQAGGVGLPRHQAGEQAGDLTDARDPAVARVVGGQARGGVEGARLGAPAAEVDSRRVWGAVGSAQ